MYDHFFDKHLAGVPSWHSTSDLITLLSCNRKDHWRWGFHFYPPHRLLSVVAFVGRLGRGNKKRARFDGKRKKTDPALIVFQLFLFSLQYVAGVSLEERGFPLYPSLRWTLTAHGVPIVARRLWPFNEGKFKFHNPRYLPRLSLNFRIFGTFLIVSEILVFRSNMSPTEAWQVSRFATRSVTSSLVFSAIPCKKLW